MNVSRLAGAASRRVKALFGIDSYLRSEDRRVLEQVIFPYFVRDKTFHRILFVGCRWYTRGYNKVFEGKHYVTLEIDPTRRRYGAREHVVGDVKEVARHLGRGELDLIVANGVYGWGVDRKEDVEKMFQGCFECLRVGGVLLVGWNDVAEHRPVPLEECASLRQFAPYVFPPLGAARCLTATPTRHTYDFYVKEP